jgi:isopentenyl diphosphate isomerase/L-lactate dehydrogenase-like FMN-dependent dehydrogenase
MPEYRVREGKRHGAFGQHGPGDVVVLTEVEASGFLDKLERVEEALPVPAFDPDTIPDTIIVTVADSPAESVDFTVVRGISEELQAALYNAGILNWDDVLMAGAVEISQNVDGVGMSKARALLAMAQREAK